MKESRMGKNIKVILFAALISTIAAAVLLCVLDRTFTFRVKEYNPYKDLSVSFETEGVIPLKKRMATGWCTFVP